MLNILIDAYAVSPTWGSEPGMGWNWVTNLAKFCNLYIITEGEWQKEIECAISAAISGSMEKDVNPTGLQKEQAERMHFYYLNVTPEIRTMCWNQGTWMFYKYYAEWELRVLDEAKRIIQELKNKGIQIDLVHKLNMIGYREPGYLWKITDRPFVWGPVGGYGGVPNAYLCDADLKTKVLENLKNVINYFMFRLHPRVRKAMKRADAVIGAYKEIYEGNWLDDKPYHVVHRLASTAASHGVFNDVMDYCLDIAGTLRIDTHRDNVIMRHVIDRYGFTYCGIIYLLNGDERLAYQLSKR